VACIFALLVPLCATAQEIEQPPIDIASLTLADIYGSVEWKGKLILLWKDCPVKNKDGTVDESPGYDPEKLGPALIHYQYGMGCYARTFPDIEIGLRSDGLMVWRERVETVETKVEYKGYEE
jgi:hypothetical protein